MEQKSAKGGNAADGSAFQAAPGRSGELVLVKVAERDAALIMAIVADELKIPINELDFKSIKRVEENL